MARDIEEITSYVDWLENESGYQDLKAAGERYREIYQLTDDPELADELTRGTEVLDNSPFIGELSDQIVAQVLGYSVSASVQPLGGLSEHKADTYEQWAAMWLARVNPGDSLRAKAYRRWLTSTHTVWLLSCGGADEDFPWDVRLPSLETCFFEPQDAPWFRPPVMGRRSKLLMREASGKYSDLAGEHDGAGERFFFDKNGKPCFQAMSAELPADSFTLSGSAKNKYGAECELIQLWDEEYEWHVIKGIEDKEGREVYRVKNYTGGVPAIVVPSVLTDDKELAKNWRPGLWTGYQYTAQLNRMRAVRATKAEKTVPHVFRILPPEVQAAVKDAMAEQLTAPSALQAGSANIVDVRATDVKFWTPLEDKDAELREARKVLERDAYAASWRLPTSPDVVQDGTVGVYQMAAQAVHSRETPLLKGAYDYPMAEMLKMAFHSRSHYEREYSLTAERTLEYGDGKEVTKGKSATLNQDDVIVVYGGERNISVQVTTKSETAAEQRLTIQQEIYDESVGLSTRPESLAKKYSNVSEQEKRLAEDLGFKVAAPLFEQQLTVMVQDYIRLAGGALFQIGPVNTAGVGGSEVAGQSPRPMPEMGTGAGGSMGGGAGEMVGVQ